MLIEIKDLKTLKLAPSLICLLKCIHNKDDAYLIELNKVADVIVMAKHLENLALIKIVCNEIKCSSFEIRRLAIINYLNSIDDKKNFENQITYVISYFKQVTGKTKIDENSTANRKFVKARLSEGYEVQDLINVIDLKYGQWKNDPKMREYIRISTLFNDEKFQSYVGQLDNKTKDFNDDI